MRATLYLAGYWIHTPIYPDLGVLVGISIGRGEFFYRRGNSTMLLGKEQAQMGLMATFLFWHTVWYEYQ